LVTHVSMALIKPSSKTNLPTLPAPAFPQVDNWGLVFTNLSEIMKHVDSLAGQRQIGSALPLVLVEMF
jgi:hypothetical protein